MTNDKIKNYVDNDIGNVSEVELHYPEILHDKYNDYPLAPERFKTDGKQRSYVEHFMTKRTM